MSERDDPKLSAFLNSPAGREAQERAAKMFEGMAVGPNPRMPEEMQIAVEADDARTERWDIAVAGYGAFTFDGTEAEAEQRRRDKARWEGAVGFKVRRQVAVEHPESLPQWCRDWIADVVDQEPRHG